MDVKLLPCGGMDNASDVTMLDKNSSGMVYVRDAVNVDISKEGKMKLRQSGIKVSDVNYQSLWQSSLHGDVFGLLENQWVKVDPDTWTHEVLMPNVGESPLYHTVLNNKVIVAAKNGIFSYDGNRARKLVIDTPPAASVSLTPGSLPSGEYKAAIAWLRDDVESALSELSFTTLDKTGGLLVMLPLPLDNTITAVRLYLSHGEGMDLQLVETLPVDTHAYEITVLPKLGRVSPFKYLSIMPSGKYLSVWQGRLWQASANIIRFSQALAYHLHDERHDFIQMPQAITFLEPVDGGIWVGQRDHVAFLQGTNPSDLVLIRKTQQAPIEGSSVRMAIETSEQSTGAQVVVWLSNLGYMAGMPDGSVTPYQSSRLKDIAAARGNSVRFNKRVITTVS